MFTPEQLKNLSSQDSEQDFELNIPNGDDGESLWQDMINLRPQVDGRYVFSKFRGGSSVLTSIAGQTIYSIDNFSTDLGNGLKKYFVALCESGNVYLHEDGSSSAPNLIMDGFTGSKPVQFINNGKFLYAFEHGGSVQKYYDIASGSAFTFNAHQPSKILSTGWITGDFTDDNVWGIKKGNTVMVLPTAQRSVSDFLSEGAVDFSPFITRIDQVEKDFITYQNKDRFSSTQRAGIGDIRDSILPYNSDLEDLLSAAGRFELNSGIFTANQDFKLSNVYRAYLVVDVLNDGTVMIPDKPVVTHTNEYNLTEGKRIGVSVELNEAGSNVEKRFLCSTRWQYSEERALAPSDERYANGAFFINSEVDRNAHTYSDYTPDRRLIRPLSEILPISSGIPLIFNSGSIRANTVARFKGSLISGNYTVSRPTPQLYSDYANAYGNAYVNVGAGTALTNTPRVSVAFEYTNGKKSDIYDSGTTLTNAFETVVVKEEQSASMSLSVDEFIVNEFGTSDDSGQFGSATYKVVVDGIDSATFDVTSSDTRQTVADKMFIAIEATTAITDVWNATQSGVTITFIHKVKGSVGNGKVLSVEYISKVVQTGQGETEGSISEYVRFIVNNTSPSTGGNDEETEDISANALSLHSLNLLVSKVFVLIKVGSEYRLLREVLPSQAQFNGMRIELPNSDAEVTALDTFTNYTVDPTTIEESVSITSGYLLSIPYQQFRIDRQYAVDTNNSIQKLIPLQFDSDKTVLRYKILAITNNDIQVGYLTGAGNTFNSEFETIHESIEVINPEYARKSGGIVFMETGQGLYRFTGQSLDPMADKNRYDVLSNSLTDVTYNDRHDEFWFAFGTDTILVMRRDGMFYQMKYPSSIRTVNYSYGKLIAGAGNHIVHTDDETKFNDTIGTVTGITAEVVSRHLSTEMTQIRMFEFKSFGKDVDATLFLDSQDERYEDTPSGTWVKVFDADFNYSEQELEISGATWAINRRAIMPRFKMQAVPKSVSAFVSKALLKGYITDNKNIAMK